MKERPILFSGPMVRAILEGRKTQTRRVVKKLDGIWRYIETNWSQEEPNKAFIRDEYGDYHPMPCPYGVPGDRLWVREAFSVYQHPSDPVVHYRADTPGDKWLKWKPSIHMPRWASRITLEVKAVRVERLQEISDEDVLREGFRMNNTAIFKLGYQGAFKNLWDSINAKKHPWESNPWVWVVEFAAPDREG